MRKTLSSLKKIIASIGLAILLMNSTHIFARSFCRISNIAAMVGNDHLDVTYTSGISANVSIFGTVVANHNSSPFQFGYDVTCVFTEYEDRPLEVVLEVDREGPNYDATLEEFHKVYDPITHVTDNMNVIVKLEKGVTPEWSRKILTTPKGNGHNLYFYYLWGNNSKEYTFRVNISFRPGLSFDSQKEYDKPLRLSFSPLIAKVTVGPGPTGAAREEHILTKIDFDVDLLPGSGEVSPIPECTGSAFTVMTPNTVSFGGIVKREAMQANKVYKQNFEVALIKMDAGETGCPVDVTPYITFEADSNKLLNENNLDLDNGMQLRLKFADQIGEPRLIQFGKEYKSKLIPGSETLYEIRQNFIAEIERIPGQNINEGTFEAIVRYIIEYR
ncbi:hypothetical protein DC083_04285 [Ignatzschineria ureiclastica]|uniref:Fimbrial-type adhesion domain-containing protein n=1 Tax=Ignatzschineria ureiclastica TaxID=472582 RepID=A0A2U2AEQ0_9GAMM|nr:hypothetical protein [Ignatzschineria ureiclastica]PWD81124.1 hypothetical protein DC083_04285 [Ignatzschineria ureiclastica]GGZ96418.1 hypothetical protein GCM10007162_10630 [Ignatzschineria ureiclastica]